MSSAWTVIRRGGGRMYGSWARTELNSIGLNTLPCGIPWVTMRSLHLPFPFLREREYMKYNCYTYINCLSLYQMLDWRSRELVRNFHRFIFPGYFLLVIHNIVSWNVAPRLAQVHSYPCAVWWPVAFTYSRIWQKDRKHSRGALLICFTQRSTRRKSEKTSYSSEGL